MCKKSHYLHNSLYAIKDLPFPSLEKLEECPFILLDTSPHRIRNSRSRVPSCFFPAPYFRISSRNVGLQKMNKETNTYISYPAVVIKTLIYHIVKTNILTKKTKHHNSQPPPRAPLPVVSAKPETPCFDGRFLQGTFASVPHHHLRGEGLDFPSRDAGGGSGTGMTPLTYSIPVPHPNASCLPTCF